MSATLNDRTREAMWRVQTVLAATLWAEAGTRPVRAIEVLAALAVNRARAAAADDVARLRFAPGAPPVGAANWALLLGRVCRAPFLFACWNPRDARHPLLRAPVGPERAIADRIAARAAAGTLPDLTDGATHWHDAAVLPGWAVGHIPCAELAGLTLYRLEHVSPDRMRSGERPCSSKDELQSRTIGLTGHSQAEPALAEPQR